MPEPFRCPDDWKLTRQQCWFVEAVVNSDDDIVSRKQVLEATSKYSEPKIVDVLLCRVRQKLAPFGIEIERVWGRGLRINAEVKAALRSGVTRFQRAEAA